MLDGLTKVEDVTAILQTYDSTLAKVALSQAALVEKDKERVLQNLDTIRTQNLIHKANIQDIVDMAKLDSRQSQKLKASLQEYAAKAAESKITDTLTRKELEEALTSAEVTVAKRQEILARYDNAAAAKKESDALDLYADGLGNVLTKAVGWVKAHPVITGLSIAVGALALAFRQAKKDIEKANEAVEEYKTQCSELESTLHSNQRTVASIKDEFAKLSYGIGSSGENIGLTSDEFERYNSIANQIADMFPDMVRGYTDQGNAILSCKGNVQALTEALREQQEAYYNTLLSGADTIYDKWNGTWFSNNFGNIFGDGTETHQAEELKTQLELYDDILQSANVSVVALSNTLEKIRSKTSATNDGGSWVLPDDDYIAVYGNLFKALGDGFELTAESRWELQRAAQQLREAVANELQELTDQDSAQLRLAVSAHLELTDAMDGLPADVRATVRTFTSSLSYEFFSAFKDDPASMYDWIDQHIIAPLTDPATRADFQAGLEFLLSKNVDVSRLNSRFVDEYGKALGKLKNAFSENANQDWLKLYASDRDIETLIDHLKDLGVILSVDNDAILAIARAFADMSDSAAESVDNTTDAIADLTAGLTKIVEKFELVKQVQKDFADSGVITADSLTSIVEKFPEMASSVNLYIAGAKSAKELLADLKNAYKADEAAWRADQKAKAYASTEFCNNLSDKQSKLIDALAESYGVDLDNFRTIEEAKADIQAQIIQHLAENYARYANATLEDLKARLELLKVQQETIQAVDINGNTDHAHQRDVWLARKKEIAALIKAIGDIEGAYKGLDEILMESWDPSKFIDLDDADDAFEKFKKKWNDWFSDMEFKVNLKYEAGDLGGANELYNQMVNKAQELLNDAYAEGMTIDDDWVQDLITKVNTYKKALADLRIEEYDELIEYNDKFDVWNHVSYTKLDKLKEKLEAINEQYITGLMNYQEWHDAFIDTAGDIYDIQRDALEELLETQIEAIKAQKEAQIDSIEVQRDVQVDAIEEQIEAFDKIIERRKRMLEDARDEADYEQEVAKRVREVAKLQERISQLALDNSREATAERLALEEELYAKQQELESYMNDYSTDAALDALDEQREAFEESKDGEIDAAEDAAEEQLKILEDELDNEVALRQQAIEQIDRDYAQMMLDIRGYFESLGITIDEELLDKLREGLDLVSQFGSYDGADSGISTNVGGLSTSSVASLVQQMKNNSAAWHNGDDAEKARLAAENERIAELLEAMGYDIWKDAAEGVWYIKIDGKTMRLFEKFHTGGVAGGVSNPKADEIFALLRKGEVILNEDQQSSLLNIFNNAGKWMQNQMSQTIGSIVGNGGTGAPDSHTESASSVDAVGGIPVTLSNEKPTRDGYVFLGWSTDSNATSATYAAGQQVGSVYAYVEGYVTPWTLYAVWEEDDSAGDSGDTGDSDDPDESDSMHVASVYHAAVWYDAIAHVYSNAAWWQTSPHIYNYGVWRDTVEKTI